MYLSTATKTNLSALELSRSLGVAYSTAWRVKRTIMRALTERGDPRRLDGCVQIDDVHLGSERNGRKCGHRAPGKQAFVVTVETETNETLEHLRHMVLEAVRSSDNAALTAWCTRRGLARGAEVYSDRLACFARSVDTGHAHSELVTAGGLAEAQCRFDRRLRLADILTRLARAVMLCEPCVETNLRLACNLQG